MRLSIITVNLNNAPGLLKTIESVIGQTFADYEWIVIDGGSNDGSTELIKQYSEHLSYWVSEPDSGIYNAMNKGILQAKGEYCFFLNSGDYFVDEKALATFFSNNFSEDVIMGNMLVCIKGKVVGKCKGKEKLTFLDVYESLIKHQASFIKSSLFKSFGQYDETLKIVADYEFFMRTVGLGGASYRYINSDLTFFDNDGISNNNGSLVLQEREKVINRHIPALMHSDYEFLSKNRNYEIVLKNRVSGIFLRFLAKGMKLFKKKS